MTQPPDRNEDARRVRYSKHIRNVEREREALLDAVLDEQSSDEAWEWTERISRKVKSA